MHKHAHVPRILCLVTSEKKERLLVVTDALPTRIQSYLIQNTRRAPRFCSPNYYKPVCPSCHSFGPASGREPSENQGLTDRIAAVEYLNIYTLYIIYILKKKKKRKKKKTQIKITSPRSSNRSTVLRRSTYISKRRELELWSTRRCFPVG